MSHVTDAHRERRIELEGAFNFRDLGGYATAGGGPVRWRRLYRADGIHKLTPADRGRVRELGLATVVDLRTGAELEERGRFPFIGELEGYHHLPLIDAVWDPATVEEQVAVMSAAELLVFQYKAMLVEGRAAIAATFELLAEPGSYPLVFHCAAGKDRTGVVAALVLSLLAVSDADVCHDYGLSREAMERMMAWIRTNRPEALDAMVAQPKAILDAPPMAMHLLLDSVRAEFGSVAGYLGDLGLSSRTLGAVRANLVA
ncbi:MAG TPA: tyrosine-protein phosphatase [Acidimicrobiales bacterium]